MVKNDSFIDDSFESFKQPTGPKPKDKWTFNLIACCLTLSTTAFQFGFYLSSLNSVTLPVQAFIRQNLFLFEMPTTTTALNQKQALLADDNSTAAFHLQNNAEIAIADLNNTPTMNANTSNTRMTLEKEMERQIASTMNLVWTFVNCLFVVGQFLGGFCSKYVLEYLGRKKGFLFNNMFTVIGSVLVIVAPFVRSPVCVMLSRFFFGLQSGIGLSIIPIYLSEIPPDSLRGGAGGFFQLFISIGITFSQILGFKEIFGNASSWYILLAFPIIPAVLGSLVSILFFPESPKALLIKNQDFEAAKKALQLLRNRTDVKDELDKIRQEALQSQESISFRDLLTSSEMRWPLITTITLVVALQFSGINAIFFYSSSIFKDAGIPGDMIQYAILLTGLINIPANIACMPLIDKFGRRSLYLTTVFLIILNYVALTVLLSLKHLSPLISYACIGCILVFITLFALAIGAIPGIYATEVFRQNARGTALALANMLGFVAFLFVAFSFPILQVVINQYVFLIFAGLLVVVFLILYKRMPETKGKSVDEIIELFQLK